jgi:hypothetical protein
MREIWAITPEMPGLSTMVAQMGWTVSGLGDLLRGFLDKAEPLPLLFLAHFVVREGVALAGG